MGGDGYILIEQRRVGAYLRVTAVCATSGVEVVFIAPPDAGPALIDAVAAGKLTHVKAKMLEADRAQSERSSVPRRPRGVVA
jgi:hypothetical protein